MPNVDESCFIAEDATVDALQVVIDIPNDLITQWNDYVRLIKDALAHASGSLPRDVYIGPQFLEDPKLPASTPEFISGRRRDLLQARHTTSYYVGIAYPRTAAGAARREAFDQVVTSNLFQRIWYPYTKLRNVGSSFEVKGTQTVPRVKKANLLRIEAASVYKAPPVASGATTKKSNLFPGGIAPGSAPATLGGGGWGNAAVAARPNAVLAVVPLAVLLAMVLLTWL